MQVSKQVGRQFCIQRQNHDNATTALGSGECSPASDVEQIGPQLLLKSTQQHLWSP